MSAITQHMSLENYSSTDSASSASSVQQTLTLTEILLLFPDPPMSKPRLTGNALLSVRDSLRGTKKLQRVGSLEPDMFNASDSKKNYKKVASTTSQDSLHFVPDTNINEPRELRAMTLPAGPTPGDIPLKNVSVSPLKKSGESNNGNASQTQVSPSKNATDTNKTRDAELDKLEKEIIQKQMEIEQLEKKHNDNKKEPAVASPITLNNNVVPVSSDRIAPLKSPSVAPLQSSHSVTPDYQSLQKSLSVPSSSSPSTSRAIRASVYIGSEQMAKLRADMGTSFDDKNFEILLRAFKGYSLSQKEHHELNYLLRELDRNEVSRALEKAQKLLIESASVTSHRKSRLVKVMDQVRGSKVPEENAVVKVSKLFIEYSPDGSPVPVNKEISQEITINNLGNHKIKYKFVPGAPSKRFEFSFSPKEGSVKKKSTQNVQIKMIVRSTIHVNHVFTMEVEGGPKFYFVVRAESEKSVFGVEVSDLDTIDDYGLRIPSVLVTMKNYLYENGALVQDSIFRISGDEKEELLVKDQLNRGTFCGCKDINCVSDLIKVWFRELPEQILNVLPPETLKNECESKSGCLKVLEKIPEPNKSLMLWLLHLLSDVAARESQNKMSARNLAIVLAPNLFSTDEFDTQDTLTLSQKVVNFIYLLIDSKLSEKYEEE